MTLKNAISDHSAIQRLAQTHPLEWQAWQALSENLSPLDEKSAAALLPMFSELRLSHFPNAALIFQQPNDAWALAYERHLAKLSKASRKAGAAQNGVFYTAAPVARYLVSRTLGQRLSGLQQAIETAIASNDEANANQYLQEAQTLRIVDPACGTGVFLLEALRILTAFYQSIQSLLPETCPIVLARYALQHQVYGVDIDPLAVAIAETRLVQWIQGFSSAFETKNETSLSLSLSENLKIGDALSPETLPCPNRDGWDFVLGNPPYISQVRKQAKRFQEQRDSMRYHHAKMDLCDAFLDWAIRHLTPTGQLAYVLPEYWMQRTSTAPLREALWRHGLLQEAWSFPDTALFPDAPGHHSALLIWRKTPDLLAFESLEKDKSSIQTAAFSIGNAEVELKANALQPKAFWLHPTSKKVVFGDPVEMTLLEKLTQAPLLLNPSDIQQGIVLPQGRLRARDRNRLPSHLQGLSEDAGVFLLMSDELKRLSLQSEEQHCIKPFYMPARLRPFEGFSTDVPDFQLIYGDLKNRHCMEKDPQLYARLRAHLDQFASINTSAFAPYGLHRARQAEWFESPQKILGLRQVERPCFAAVSHPAYVNESFYIIRPNRTSDINVPPVDLPYWVALLNSQVAWFWFYKQKRKGHRLQIDKDVLSTLPAPACITSCLQAEISELSETLASVTVLKNTSRHHHLKQQLEHCVAAAYGLTSAEKTALAAWQTTLPI